MMSSHAPQNDHLLHVGVQGKLRLHELPRLVIVPSRKGSRKGRRKGSTKGSRKGSRTGSRKGRGNMNVVTTYVCIICMYEQGTCEKNLC